MAVLECTGCGERTYSAVAVSRPELVGSCPECDADRIVVELIHDRRTGEDRRMGVQRVWDPEPRTGGDRRDRV